MIPPAELVRLEIPAAPAFVGVARTVVVAIATSVEGLDDDRLEDLRIAVSEACTNAVEAGAGDEGERRVVLRCLVDDASFAVHIAEAGGRTVAGGEADTMRSERGWGVQLIRALVDDVAFDDLDAVTLTMALGPDGRPA